MGGKGSGSVNAVLMRLDGTKIKADGTEEKSEFFEALQLPEGDYLNLEISPEQAVKLRNLAIRMKFGTSAAMPMLCLGGSKCPLKECPLDSKSGYPVGKRCHPPGTMIRVAGGGSVPIEKLDPTKHGLVSFYKKRQRVVERWGVGYSFDVASKPFKGNLIELKTKVTSHQVTPDHISIARFNEKAIHKFCVYLMRQGNHWRIGKSSVLRMNYSSRKEGKRQLSFSRRGVMEGADAMWLLGVYDTNTEALLAEERLSLEWHTSRVSFVDCLHKTDSKYDGLYKWATREQIQEHHDLVARPESFYRDKLASIGKSIEFPIWAKDNAERTHEDVKTFATYAMFIRACNLIPEIMDVPVYPKEINGCLHDTKADWYSLSLREIPYEGLVYSLDVKDKYKTYFANEIATHNCPIEARYIQVKTQSYVEDLEIDVNSPTQMSMINRLVEIDLMDFRANASLAADEEAQTLLKTATYTNGDFTTETLSIHPLIEIKDRHHKQRMQILEALVATPKEKYKKASSLKKKDTEDSAHHLARLRDAYEIIQKEGAAAMKKIASEAETVKVSEEADWSEDGSGLD